MASQLLPGITIFPNEVWEMIFAYGEQKDFLVISSVCRQLHKAVERNLHREFNWIPETLPSILNLGLELQLGSKPAPPRPYLLIQRLANRPDLAACFKNVKMLAVLDDSRLEWDIPKKGRRETEEDLHFWRRFIDLQDIKGSWRAALLHGRMDVIVALLLVLLRNVQSVELRVRGSMKRSLVFEALAHNYRDAGTSIRTKRAIKSITISTDNDNKSFWANQPPPGLLGFQNVHELNYQMTSLALLPQLESLSVSTLQCELLSDPPIFNPEYSSVLATNLKKLKLHRSLLIQQKLHDILSETRHLEELECDLQYDFAWGVYHAGRIHAALAKVSKTLTHLKLSIQVQNNDFFWGFFGIFGSLRTFEKLRYVHYSSCQ
jgi:hypothetical protein